MNILMKTFETVIERLLVDDLNMFQERDLSNAREGETLGETLAI